MKYPDYFAVGGIIILLMLFGLRMLIQRRKQALAMQTPIAARSAEKGMHFRDWLIKQASDQAGADLSGDPIALMRLKEVAEKAAVEISRSGKTVVDLPFIYADSSGPKHFKLEITRSMLAGMKLQ